MIDGRGVGLAELQLGEAGIERIALHELIVLADVDTNDVINLGGGNNLNGGGTPCPCDFGIDIGMPGIGGGDDFQSATFEIYHMDGDDLMTEFVGQAIGVRVTSVGLPGSSRNGSSKLSGEIPPPDGGPPDPPSETVPAPAPLALLGIGLLGAALTRSRRRK